MKSMLNLKQSLAEAVGKGVAMGHFNFAELTEMKGILAAAKELNLPVIFGTSEGEREFIGERQAVALIRSLREELGLPLYLNADHTHSLEKAVQAAEAGYDEILFDGGKLPWEENLAQTQAVVSAVKKINPEILVEGEIGYIGSSSEILKEMPAGAALRPEDLTTPEQAREFVAKTGVDLLAPAVGNVHGMFADMPNPKLDIGRVSAIRQAAGVPLVLHGGSGVADEDFRAAIKAGANIVHISTELRRAWKNGLTAGLQGEELAPYKVAAPAVEAVKKVVLERLRLFNGF